MLGKASVIKTRNQVKDIPVHQERVFSFMTIPFVLPCKNSEKKVIKILQAIFILYEYKIPFRETANIYSRCYLDHNLSYVTHYTTLEFLLVFYMIITIGKRT